VPQCWRIKGSVVACAQDNWLARCLADGPDDAAATLECSVPLLKSRGQAASLTLRRLKAPVPRVPVLVEYFPIFCVSPAPTRILVLMQIQPPKGRRLMRGVWLSRA
jgi:hypothetical protein